jgi:hypothetical protein
MNAETQVEPEIESPGERRRRRRDEARGFSINRKFVAIAYGGEIVLIITSMVGSYLFARMYGHGDGPTILMMMLAPIAYAVIEMVRVPLAIAARTQRSWPIKLLAGFGVLMAAGVTVKSLSQLGEQMFHPRLIGVVEAKEALAVKERERAGVGDKIEATDAVVTQRAEELKAIEQRSMGLAAQMATVSKPTCMATGGVGKNGRKWSNMKCVPDPKAEIISANLRLAGADHSEASKKLDEARIARSKFDTVALDREVSEAKTAHKQAVMHSQIHSFTAMAFGKDPTDVTDGEVHEFLRLFVFFPAIFASLASTLLALASVTSIKPRAPTISIPDAGGQYALGGLAEHIIRETTRQVHGDASKTVSTAAQTASLKVVA